MESVKVVLQGGLGNQLFQLAAAYYMARKRVNVTIIANTSLLRDDVRRPHLWDFPELGSLVVREDRSLKLIHAAKHLNKLGLSSLTGYYFEPHPFHFSKSTNNRIKNYIGFFQSYRYLSYFSSIVNPIFDSISSTRCIKLDRPTHHVAIHVRRGDYVSNNDASNFHGVIGMDYYSQAIDICRQKYGNCRFFIYSDDINWCKKNFMPYNVSYVTSKTSDLWDDFLHMRTFQTAIIANSSFSYAALSLSSNVENKMLIMPYKWLNNKNHNWSELMLGPWCAI